MTILARLSYFFISKNRKITVCIVFLVPFHKLILGLCSFASALMHCGEHSEANACAETVLMSDPVNVKVSIRVQ